MWLTSKYNSRYYIEDFLNIYSMVYTALCISIYYYEFWIVAVFQYKIVKVTAEMFFSLLDTVLRF